MSDSGHGAQVVNVTASRTFELDVQQLEQILYKVRDLPVVVVSVAGAYRTGKSFLLNFFLRYLKAPQSAREDGSWLGEDSEPLVGFNWRSGITRMTMGILMWSEPFIATLSSGEKVAVLLLDTQGAFDNKTSVRDYSTVFAMSTLLSSVQIYNISQNIQEDDLQHLQLFTEYAKLVKDQNVSAFQMLQFLVRDWQFSEDYAFGAEGGEELLRDKLTISHTLAEELMDIREHILSSFEKVSCFLLPHPGFKVLSSKFKGNISDIDITFKTQLIDYVSSLFSPAMLTPKKIGGAKVTAGDLCQYFKSYMELFNSDTLPTPTNILKTTVEAGLMAAVNEARDNYEKGMNSECGPNKPSIPAVDLNELHRKYLSSTQAMFTQKKKLGSKEDAEIYLTKLTEELEKRLPQFVQMNIAKIQTAITNANESYDEAIKKICGADMIVCVHPLDLEKVHRAGVEAATKTYDASRKRLTENKDAERSHFLQSFEKRFITLNIANEQNNMMVVSTLAMEYWKKMQEKIGHGTAMKDVELSHEHEIALKEALDKFASKRQIASVYTEDVFKDQLTKLINNSFVQLNLLNESLNSIAVQAAVQIYDDYMNRWKGQCMHPTDLEHEHQQALCRVLLTFRPNRECSAGFDYSDKDERTLQEILRQRYDVIEALNKYANANAAQEALSVYLDSMEDLCRPSLYWILLNPIINSLSDRPKYHDKSKQKALALFDEKRKSTGHTSEYSVDLMKSKLIEMIEEIYRKRYLVQGSEFLPIVSKLVQMAKTYFLTTTMPPAAIGDLGLMALAQNS